MKLKFSQEDINRQKSVTPGWYDCVIKDANDELASDQQSTNTVVDFLILDGAFVGVPLRTWINEKAPGLYIQFFEAVLGQKIGPGTEVETTAVKGRKVKVFVANEEYKKRMTNVVKDYRPM